MNKSMELVYVIVCADRVSGPAYYGPVLPGGHLLLDVLRGSVLAHTACCHICDRSQGHAHPLPHRLGRTRCPCRAVRRPAIFSEGGETTVSAPLLTTFNT